MSVLLSRADALAAYLMTVDGLQGITWMVERARNLDSEFTKATAKKLGLGVIRFLGGTNKDRNLNSVRLAARYSVTLFFKPVIKAGVPRDGSKEPADVAELAARAMHHWFPVETPTKSQVRFEVTGMQTADAEHFHVIRIDAESVVQFSSEPVSLIEP
ncbi:hypothetical protein OKA04_23460 [Luteolibacter flavescens]|uniref:Uncharacterized protein n=1 Tax=Luteolibacter flavescens TaxID=1859460 RepID=A0ABT3FVX4_9BACT|nr:hypothetical protein [Luteolibacter flavescens]MCW1887715.1 hypothetical protein [Luteolibacter flavescens]